MWCDCYDGCDCDDEFFCRRWRKTMMMMMMMTMLTMMFMIIMMIYVCVHRYKYVCVHYQFISSYWLQHIMICSCSSTICCIFIKKIIIFHHTDHPHPHTPYCSLYHYLHIIISHLISLLLLPSFFLIYFSCTISYSPVGRLSIKHVWWDMRVPYWYCYKIRQTLTFKIR